LAKKYGAKIMDAPYSEVEDEYILIFNTFESCLQSMWDNAEEVQKRIEDFELKCKLDAEIEANKPIEVEPVKIIKVYTIDEIVNGETKNSLKTTDGKYHSTQDGSCYSYWHGEGCYPNRGTDYFFNTSANGKREGLINLNKLLAE